jgi:hypothetical protein
MGHHVLGRIIAGIGFVFSLQAAVTQAVPVSTPNPIPDSLRPWSSWVERDNPDRVCPTSFNNGEERRCYWPSALELGLDKHGGTFGQQLEVYRELRIALPGDAEHWPQDVKVDGKPGAVSAGEDGMPGLMLAAGPHSVSGSFIWDELPESLQVPPQTALIMLRLNGRPVGSPRLDNGGHLWLEARGGSEDGADALELHVSRLIDDGIPLMVTTQLTMSVSGKNRENVFPTVVLPGYTPTALQSDLPARLEADGRLHVQLRPGQWNVSVTARRMMPQNTVTLPAPAAGAAPLADQEVWVFQGHNELRVVTPTASAPVDAKLVNLPGAWRNLPAFQIKPGESLQLAESRRGDPEAAPDELSLNRAIWLDFDGKGYSVSDRIGGNFHRNWRMEMQEPAELDHVAILGADQFITRSGKLSGVEVRDGRTDIRADSRIESDSRTLPAVGWNEDVKSLHIDLNLPAGWRLLGATGVDHVVGSWAELWTLLDFFIVLVIAFAFGKLWGWRWAALAAFALVIGYHEIDAPRWAWLAALAGAALTKVLPERARLQRVIVIYRNAAILVLVLIMLPFAIKQIRQATYPAFDAPEQSELATRMGVAGAAPYDPYDAGAADQRSDSSLLDKNADYAAAPAAAPAAAAPPAFAPPGAANEMEQEKKDMEPAPAQKAKAALAPDFNVRPRIANLSKVSPAYSANAEVKQADPNTIVQTGPGMPRWHNVNYSLQWAGPVDHTQEMHLWLLPPLLNSLLDVLRVVLFGLLIARLTGLPLRLPQRLGPGAATAVLLGCLACSGLVPDNARAETIPDQQTLSQLKEHLDKPAPCLPACADFARMQLEVHGEALQLRLEAHALQDVALPLPGAGGRWQVESIVVDGKPAAGLQRDDNGALWLALDAGVHQVVMSGTLGHTENLQLELPLKPHRAEIKAEGWTVLGLHENGLADDNLQLTRIATNDHKAAQDSVLPSFVRVERTLLLGLEWRVHTRVQRIVPQEGPIIVAVPLLPGESISATVPRVEKGVAQVSLGAQTDAMEWDSSLAQRAEITLKAAAQSELIETWALDAGTMWHVDVSGIAPVQRQDAQTHWAPRWNPWPGEEVHLKIGKLPGAPGQTVALDASGYHLKPGMRSSDVALDLSMRSSRAGLHTITLPEGAVLQSVTVKVAQSENPLNLRLDGRKLNLPLQPGAQGFHIEWRQPGGIETWFSAPPVDLGMNGANADMQIELPHDRWSLLAGGPHVGPAILIWDIAVAMALLAWVLARIELTPLGWRQWFLLTIGLTQIPVIGAAVIVLWLFALGLRQRGGERAGMLVFNIAQIGLAVWSVLALFMLFHAVKASLIGNPDMQVTGSESYANHFHWYQDRYGPGLPQPWVLSLPLIVYRGLMLMWALWLAYSLLKWLRWGWDAFTTGGYWRELSPKGGAETKVPNEAGKTSQGEGESQEEAERQEQPPASP